MLTLVTGLPGAGKTLFTLHDLHNRCQGPKANPKRLVFHYGIPGVKLEGWHRLKSPADWMRVPLGSVVVFDEAYAVFPKRSPSAKRPDFITLLAQHRKRGLDIYVICQNPTQIDADVRKLVEQHIDYKRVLRSKKVTRREWSRVSDPLQAADRKEAMTTTHAMPEAFFDKYHSAELHTVQPFNYTRLVAGIAAFVLVVVGLGYFGFTHVWELVEGDDDKPATVSSPRAEKQPQGEWNPAVQIAQGMASEEAKGVDMFIPRVAGEDWTAPAYDALRAVKSYPRPHCALFESGPRRGECQCWSQQGTRMRVLPHVCYRIVREGWWDPAQAAGRVASKAEPVSSARTAQLFGDVGDGGTVSAEELQGWRVQ